MTVAEVVIVCVICYLTGLFAGHYFFAPKKSDIAGTLKLKTDESDGEIYLFLELARPPESLFKMDTVRFQIDKDSARK